MPLSLGFWLIRGSALGPIGGLSARQFNSCLPRIEEKRREREREREHPAYVPSEVWPSFTFTFTIPVVAHEWMELQPNLCICGIVQICA